LRDDIKSKAARGQADGRLAQQFAAAGANILSALAAIEARRVSRAQDFMRDLEATLGTEHPEVIRRGERFERGKAVELGLRTQAERLKRRPTIGEGQSLVYGRVIDRRRYPVPGVHLTVVIEDGQTALAEKTSDEYGDFAIVLCTNRGAVPGGSRSAWRLLATGDDGAILSDQAFELAPGASVYLEVQLPEDNVTEGRTSRAG
jgi:hypothetical protein